MRTDAIRLACLAGWLSVACLSAGCHRGGDVESSSPRGDVDVVWRLSDWPSVEASPVPPFQPAPPGVELADAAFRPRGSSRALINDDQRYTFARPEFQFVYRDAEYRVPDAAESTLEVGLPGDLLPCEELTAEITFTSIDASVVNRVSAQCAHVIVGDVLRVTVANPPVLRGSVVDFWIQARHPSTQGLRQRRFAIAKVPRGARLEFSYGVESPGWAPDAAAATFHVLVDGDAKPIFSARLDPALNASQRRWFDADVDLGRWAGRSITLILQTGVDRTEDRRAYSRAVWGDPKIVAPRAPAKAHRPNVLLVSLDTLRAHSVSVYGYERPTMPFLGELARDGVVFTQAVAQSTTTPQSHMTLFTSLYPSTHGITDLTRTSDLQAYRTFAEILREHGYVTAAVTEDGLLQATLGFERGFDSYKENKTSELTAATGQIETTFHDAADWLDAHSHDPFFLFVHTYQVHDPYSPPATYRAMFATGAEPESPREKLDRYEGEIRYADDQLAALWRTVERLGLADDTIVIVTSDHGEEFGEHGLLRHGTDLYDETLLVPLVMRAPQLLPRGLRVDSQVGLIDVLPTLLELLGIPIPSNVQGRSVVALLGNDVAARGTLAAELETRELFAEAWGGIRLRTDGSADETWKPPLYALRTPKLKIVLDPNAPSPATSVVAFDLAADPREQDRTGTVAHDGAETLRRYATASQRPANAAAPAAPQPDAATVDKLRALGYVR